MKKDLLVCYTESYFTHIKNTTNTVPSLSLTRSDLTQYRKAKLEPILDIELT